MDQGAAYQWLRDESFTPPVTFLTRLDGTATANLQEMVCLLQKARRPTNRKCTAVSEPDRAEFLHRYGHHVRQVPMLASPLTGDLPCCGLARMHLSALRLDGWSSAELRALPDVLLGWPAELLLSEAVERQGW